MIPVVLHAVEEAEGSFEAAPHRYGRVAVGTEVPLAHVVDAVLRLAQLGRQQCHVGRWTRVRAPVRTHPLLHVDRVPARHERGARGAAKLIHVMALESNSVGYKGIQLGRLHCGVVPAYVGVAEIVGQHDDDVRL